MKENELILYTTEDGRIAIRLRAQDDFVWLTQAEINELFQTIPQNITLHIKAIYKDGELQSKATCKDYLQVRQESRREVRRQLTHYNLAGYRVRSARVAQFRQWATAHLQEYLIKGFVLDDGRLKKSCQLGLF